MKNNSTLKLATSLFVCCLVSLFVFSTKAQTSIFFENFQTVTAPALPVGWASTNPSGGFLFETGDSTAANSGGFWAIDPHGQFAFASDDACNCDMSEVRLILPPQNFSGVTSATLNAEVWLDNVYGSAPFETARIEASLDNGTTWTPVGSDFAPIEAWQSISIDLSAFDGLTNVLIAFRFDDNGNWGRGLAVDDVDIQGITSAVCFFSENFQTVTAPALPAGWASTNPNGGFVFETGDSTAANSGGFWAIDPHGQFAFASDDACNCNMSEVRLILPSQNFSSYTSVTLKAQVWLDNVYGSAPFETARIEVSTDGGTTWVPVGSDFAPVEAWQAITIDLSAYDGQSNVLVSFRFDDNGNWGRGLAIDDLCLEGATDVVCVFSENFDGVAAPALPGGWTSTNPGGGFLFETGDSTAANSGGFWAITPHGQFAFASDDACNCDMSEVRLILPPQDFTDVSFLTLNAEVWLDNVYGSAPFETARVEVSLDNGVTWVPVGADFPPIEAWQSISVDLSTYDGLNNVWVAFRFDDNSNWGRGLAVDDLCIEGITDLTCSIDEGFGAVTAPALPPSWTSTNPNGGFVFETGDSTAANSGGFWAIDPHGQFAFASDDACNCDMSEVRLVLPPQDFSSLTVVSVRAEVWLDNVYGSAPFETARVEVSTDNGASWTAAGIDFPPLEAWQDITRDLSPWAGQSNVWVAFRFDDNNNWGRGLAVDDVSICSPSGGFDVEITSTSRLNAEYTIVPTSQETGAVISAEVTNTGSADVTNLVLTSRLFNEVDPVVPVATLTTTPISLGSGASMILDNNPSGLPIGGVGRWYVEHSLTHDDSGSESNNENDTLVTPIFEISDFIYARDDTLSVDAGGFGIGGGANDNANIGQTFEFQVEAFIGSIQVTLDNPNPGLDVLAVIYACDATGTPFGTGIDTTETQLTVGGGNPETFDLSFDSPVTLTPGIYMFSVLETADNISLQGYEEIYTAPGGSILGTNWVSWDSNPNGAGVWTEPTTLVPAFAVAYAIRPFLAEEACSPGDLLGGGGTGVVCGTAGTFNFATDGSEQIPSGGGFGWNFTPGPGAGGGVATGFSITNSSSNIEWDADLNGILSDNALMPLTGTWNAQGFVYADADNIGGSLCGFTTGTFIVTFSPDINSAPTSTSETCGFSDGTATANASGGFGSLTVDWSNGSSGNMITGLSAGIYNFTITDETGCTAEGSVTVSSSGGPNPVVDAVSDVLCNGGSSGNIGLSVTGGLPPYTFLWSNGAMTEDLNDIPAGAYEATVTDASGCSFVIAAIEINEPAPLDINNSGITPVLCFGASDGAVDVTIVGGTPSYLYMWSNGANTEDLVDVPAGDYFLTITDGNGCVLESPDPFTVDSPDELVPSASIMNESSAGAMNGAVDLSVTGGTEPYSYEWSSGATTSVISDLTAGDYTVTIIDGNGCESISTWTVQISVGVENIQGLKNLSLYPNPSDNRVYIELDLENAMNVKLDIFTVTGQKLLSFPAENVFEKQYELFMKDFHAGIYLARFTIDGQIITKRFTIARY